MSADKEHRKNLKKLANMITDLKVMKAELCDEKDDSSIKGDKLATKENSIKGLIERIKIDSDNLSDMKKRHGKNYNDVTIITLKTNIRNNIKSSVSELKELSNLVAKEEKKKKLKPEELTYHNNLVKILTESLELIEQSFDKSKNNADSFKPMYANKRQETKFDEIRRKRSKSRERRGKSTERTAKSKERNIELEEVVIENEQEMVFMDKVQDNMKAQDAMLDNISRGLDDLAVIANEMNKNLAIQKAALEIVDEKIDNNISKLKNANSKLKKILEESGGSTKWVAVIILTIAILGLTGVIIPVF
jgi:hypothetical protein